MFSDTTIHIMQNINNPPIAEGFFAKYGSLISPLIVALTFTFNIWYTARTKRQESDRAWYLKAYFENQISSVNAFFADSDKLFKEKSQSYFDLSSDISSEKKNEFVATFLLELGNIKRKFEIEILEILKYTYPHIFAEINNSILDMEDAATESLEKANASEAYHEYIRTIYNVKAKLIVLLSQPALIKTHQIKNKP